MKKLFTLATAIMLMMACSSESENRISKTSVDIFVNQTHQLTYSSNCVWRSDNALIASVSNGLVTGHYVGTTNVYANNDACKVTVYPRNEFYIDAFVDFGAHYTKARDYYLKKGAKELSSTSTGGFLEGRDGEYYIYLCSNDVVTATALYTSLSRLEICTEYLLERYILVTEDDDIYMFIDPTQSFMVGLSFNTDYKEEYMVNIIYMPYDSRASVTDYFDLVRETINL